MVLEGEVAVIPECPVSEKPCLSAVFPLPRPSFFLAGCALFSIAHFFFIDI